MTLPKPPPRRRIPGFSPGRRTSTSTPERLRRMTEKHEEEERPFDPERRGTWRGSGRELVVNPNQFHKDLEELIIKRWGRTFSEPEEKLAEAKRILKEGGRPGDVLNELDELLDTHGVESIPGIKAEISYLNAGDTYEPTIMYSYDDNKYFISDWGTIVEEGSSNAEEEAWDDWLESEVRRELEAEFEARLEGKEKLLDRVTDWLERADSNVLKSKFWDALSDAGGEYVHESDGSVFVSKKDKAVQGLADLLLEELSAAPEQTSFGFNPRRRNGGAMTAEEFSALLKSEADVRGRVLRTDFSPRSGQLFIHYFNLPALPEGERREPAESENNRFMFVVDGFSSGRTSFGQGTPIAAAKVKLEHSINSGSREYRLRGKSGAPDQVARYLAKHLTKIAAEVPPKYTHSRAPNARGRKISYRVRGTADDHRDRYMKFGHSSRTLTGEFLTEPEAMRAAERFMREQAPAGREAKVWIEKSWPSGDFSVLGKWVGENGRWVSGHR